MSALAVIAIVVAVVVVLAILAFVLPRARERQYERRRVQAGELRDEARIRGARAERQSARADEQAARARRDAAEAEERAVRARSEREAAREHAARADELDPDVDDDRARERDREFGSDLESNGDRAESAAQQRRS